MLTRTRLKIIGSIIFFIAVLVSCAISEAKSRSLEFHTRDYAYYLQFAAKLLDPKSAHFYSINPIGYNWMQFNGMEGVKSFYQATHFEPIKYIYGVLYSIVKTPDILFLFIATVFFSPMLYLVFRFPLQTKKDGWFVLALVILYAVYPASFKTPSYDLRPYIFLAPFFVLLILSLTFSRPLWERLLWLNFLFLAREEAIILGACSIAYAFFSIADPSLRKKTVLFMTAVWLFWTSLTGVYFSWTGYPTPYLNSPAGLYQRAIDWLLKGPLNLAIAIILGVALLVVFLLSVKTLSRRNAYHPIIILAVYSTILAILLYQWFTTNIAGSSVTLSGLVDDLLFSERYMLHFGALLVLILLCWLFFRRVNSWSVIVAMGLLEVCFVVASLVARSRGFPIILSTAIAGERTAGDVLALRQSTNRYETWILTDFATHQAFYDYEHVYIYNRLPAQIVTHNTQFYSADGDIVQELAEKYTEYIVISKGSESTINAILTKGNLTTTKLFDDGQYEALRINR
jgi:hypothetical protein